MQWTLCENKNQFYVKELVLLKFCMIHLHLRRDVFTISSLCIHIRLFMKNVYCTYRVFKAIECKLFCLLLLNSIPISAGNPGSS